MTDASTPAQREAENLETTEFVWNGETFILPSDPDDWPWGASRAFDQGHFTLFVEELLSDPALPPDQHDKFLAAVKPQVLRNKHGADFVREMGVALGFAQTP